LQYTSHSCGDAPGFSILERRSGASCVVGVIPVIVPAKLENLQSSEVQQLEPSLFDGGSARGFCLSWWCLGGESLGGIVEACVAGSVV
jgi:hypothetical protein